MVRRSNTIKRGAQLSSVPVGVTVPEKGVNAVSSFSRLQPDECLYAYNILPTERGLQSRLGTREWTNGISGTPRTIISFHGKADDRTDDKLFATGQDGIYDVSSSGDAGATLAYSFATTGSTAGYGNWVYWVSLSGDEYIYYADSANGLLEYTASTDTWAAVTGITGLDETLVRFIAIHKLRIWLVLEDDNDVYYLGADANSGGATAFALGNKMPNGGDVVGIWTFSRDSGAGVDDFFVSLGRGGDVLVYQGTDPSSATTWSLVGAWKVGTLPTGRRMALEYGGDIFILSSLGISSLNSLFSGAESTELGQGPLSKINSLIRTRMATEVQTEGWEIDWFPSEGFLVIQSPQRAGNPDEWLHYCMNMTIKGWGFWRGVEAQCMGVWRENFYYGKEDGSIWYLNGSRDNVSFDNTNGEPVSFSLLGGYSDVGFPGMQKQAMLVRAYFVGSNLTSYDVKVLANFDLREILSPSEGDFATGYLWDTAQWDQALWGGDVSYNRVFGGSNIGTALAVALRGRTSSRVRLAEIGAMVRVGGFL